MGTDWEFAEREPARLREFTQDELDFARNSRLDDMPNWRLILEQLDDMPNLDLYHDRCKDELRRRGFTDAEISEMERIAHELVVPYNEALPYSELWQDDSLVEPAILWHFEQGLIDEAQRDVLLVFNRNCRDRN